MALAIAKIKPGLMPFSHSKMATESFAAMKTAFNRATLAFNRAEIECYRLTFRNPILTVAIIAYFFKLQCLQNTVGNILARYVKFLT